MQDSVARVKLLQGRSAAATEQALDIASSDFAHQVFEKRGVPIGNLLPKTHGRAVPQICSKTQIALAAVDLAAAGPTEARSSNRKSLAENARTNYKSFLSAPTRGRFTARFEDA